MTVKIEKMMICEVIHRLSTKKMSYKQETHCEQKSDTGVEVNLLQEYTFICLDIFSDIIQNENRKIKNSLEEWLVFLSQDDPEMIIKLLNQNSDFQKIYEEIYTLCLNMEGMMEMFSKELEILDRNTVKLMIDEMEEELAQVKASVAKQVEEQVAEKVAEQVAQAKENIARELEEEKQKIEEEKQRADKAEEENVRLRKKLMELQKL